MGPDFSSFYPPAAYDTQFSWTLYVSAPTFFNPTYMQFMCFPQRCSLLLAKAGLRMRHASKQRAPPSPDMSKYASTVVPETTKKQPEGKSSIIGHQANPCQLLKTTSIGYQAPLFPLVRRWRKNKNIHPRESRLRRSTYTTAFPFVPKTWARLAHERTTLTRKLNTSCLRYANDN